MKENKNVDFESYDKDKIRLSYSNSIISEHYRLNHIRLPLQMNFKPKEDITAYELALCLKHLFIETYQDDVNTEDSYLRHFEIINQNK